MASKGCRGGRTRIVVRTVMDISSILYQEPNNLCVASRSPIKQGGISIFAGRIDGRAVLQQNLHDFDVALDSRANQGSISLVAGSKDRRAVLQ